MTRLALIAIMAGLVAQTTVAAQTPGSTADENRLPAFGQGPGSKADENRTPVYGNAALQLPPIPSFAGPSTGGPVINQGPPPTRSPISPYLNLNRNSLGGGGGVSAIDYYNFVRPGTQTYGNNYGPPGVGTAPYGRQGAGIDSDVRLDSDTTLRSAGNIPSAFNNYGRYFNSMGTIGSGQRGGPQQPARQRR